MRKTNEVVQVMNYNDSENRRFGNPQTGRVYSPCGVSPCLNTCGGGDRQPKVLLAYEMENDGHHCGDPE